jgi:hypothetical protein
MWQWDVFFWVALGFGSLGVLGVDDWGIGWEERVGGKGGRKGWEERVGGKVGRKGVVCCFFCFFSGLGIFYGRVGRSFNIGKIFLGVWEKVMSVRLIWFFIREILNNMVTQYIIFGKYKIGFRTSLP